MVRSGSHERQHLTRPLAEQAPRFPPATASPPIGAMFMERAGDIVQEQARPRGGLAETHSPRGLYRWHAVMRTRPEL